MAEGFEASLEIAGGDIRAASLGDAGRGGGNQYKAHPSKLVSRALHGGVSFPY